MNAKGIKFSTHTSSLLDIVNGSVLVSMLMLTSLEVKWTLQLWEIPVLL